MRVLIVEDSEPVRERLKRMLGELPDVEICGETGNAAEAVALVATLNPDLVTLDIRLPGGGSGLDVLRSVEGLEHAPKFIVLTNYPYPQYEKKCVELGAEFFFDKSNEFECVVEVLKRMSRRCSVAE